MKRQQATQSRPPSRWDALKSEPSSSSAPSRHRPRDKLLPNYETTSTPTYKTSHGGYRSCQYKGKHSSSGGTSYRSDSSTGGSWRRRAAANDSSNSGTQETPVTPTAEEESVKEAMNNLQNSIKLYLDTSKDGGGDSPNSKSHGSILLFLQQLSATLFDSSDTTKSSAQSLPPQENNSINLLPHISNDVIWESSYSLIHNIQSLSQVKETRVECIQLTHKISTVALQCLQSLIHNQHQLQQQKQSVRNKSMTDLRLCECATILLDASIVYSFLDGDGATINASDILPCKATLYSCLSKIIAISTLLNVAPASAANGKHMKDKKQGPLCPWGAEKTVHLVVRQSILPFMELLTDEANSDTTTSLSAPMKMKYCHGAMECLYLLLKDPNWDDRSLESISEQKPQMSKHAAAILAPLVVDVLHDGKEKQRVNPLRLRALNAISAYWTWSVEYAQSAEMKSSLQNANQIMFKPCQCMAAALNALSVLKKGKAQANKNANSHELNVPSIARQLQSMMQDKDYERLLPKLLNLLMMLCTAYPSASASQWHLFLEQSGAKRSPLVSILEVGASALSNGNFDDNACITLPCALRATSTLLTAMPLSLWIPGESRQSIRMTGGNFSSRVRNALVNVIQSTTSLMSLVKDKVACGWLSKKSMTRQLMDSVMLQVSQLAAKLCTILPFNGENSILLQPAICLVQCAADIYGASAKAIANEPLMPEIELKNTLLFKAMTNSSYIITECLGVCSTDSANPAEIWLSGPSSYEFIGLLLTDSYWKYHITKERVDMLSSVAKASTQTLAREPFNLAAFCGVCTAHCRNQLDAESRVLGVKLIESFIVGRKCCSLEDESHSIVLTAVRESLCPLLLAALKDSSSAVRSCAASSFGSLLKDDWYSLLGLDLSIGGKDELLVDWTHVQSIITLCSVDGEKNANVRASACKAMGDTCTTCIACPEHGTIPNVFISEFTTRICKAMARALTDQNASVRSMALFAVGNNALALKELHNVNQEVDLPLSSITTPFPSVCKCLSDKDEKVIANAIRTISHMSFFVYHPDFTSVVRDEAWKPLDLYRSLISDFSGRIKFALDDAAGQLSQELTWKQRNGAKKHAWGSCTTLGTMLSFSNLLPLIDDDTLLESTLSNLFQCIQLSSIVNEKIATSASKALVTLPTELWHHLSGKCDSIGRGLATCFGFLEEKTMASYRDDVETLTNVLLSCAKKSDFCSLFLLQESVPFSIEYFYQWIVTQGVEAGILEEVAAAVSSQEVEQILDVSIAQRFLSRTIQQNRRQGSPCKVNIASLRLGEDDDEDDEL